MPPTTLQLLKLPEPLYDVRRLLLAFESQWGCPASAEQIAAAFGLSEASVESRMRELESQGFVRRVYGGEKFEAVWPAMGEVG